MNLFSRFQAGELFSSLLRDSRECSSALSICRLDKSRNLQPRAQEWIFCNRTYERGRSFYLVREERDSTMHDGNSKEKGAGKLKYLQCFYDSMIIYFYSASLICSAIDTLVTITIMRKYATLCILQTPTSGCWIRELSYPVQRCLRECWVRCCACGHEVHPQGN